MAVKTIDNRIRLWALLDDDDRLGKAVGLQRRLQQTLLRRRHVIRVVVVGATSSCLTHSTQSTGCERKGL